MMIVARELRRLQGWSVDTPQTRAALVALVSSAIESCQPQFQALVARVADAQAHAVSGLETVIRDAAEESARRARLAETKAAAAEKHAESIAANTAAATQRLDDWLTKTNAQLKKRANQPWYIQILPSLGTSALCGLVMIMALTLLRPGWTLTPRQREALAIGESVTRIYLAAPPARQAEMRRVNRWRLPERADTAAVAPRPSP